MAEGGGTALRELFARFFVDFDDTALVKGAHAVDGLFEKLAEVGHALVGGAIVGELIHFTHTVIEQGFALTITAQRLGIATQALQEWQYVGNLAGVSTEEMTAGLRILQRNLFSAGEGGAEAAKDFAKIGIVGQDLKESDLDKVLEKAADGFAKLQNPIEQTALAQKLFGRGGAALLPLLKKGSAGIAEMKEEFKELGAGLNDDTIHAANEAEHAIFKLGLSARSLISNAMLPFIKATVFVAEKLKDWLIGFKKLAAGSSIVSAALIALGTVAAFMAGRVLITFLPVIATTLAWAAALGAVILIIDEVITLFSGGESVIGDWIDQNFGEGSAKAFVASVKEIWEGIKAGLDPVLTALKGDVLKDMKDALHEVQDLVDHIVAGFKYLGSVIHGSTDLGKTWLGSIGRAIGLKDNSADGGKPVPFQAGPGVALGAAGTNTPGAINLPPEQSLFGSLPGGNVISSVGALGGPPPIPSSSGGDAAKIQNIINVAVAPNAAPDPKLVPMVRQAVTEALDQANRDTSAGM